VYEDHVSEYGTQTIWEAIASSRGHSALGGGDSISAMNKYALRERFDYVCTAGGGMVRFLSGEELPWLRLSECRRYGLVNLQMNERRSE
jgi:phosphoglycerate kinase